jgi:hypothetical protein
MLLAMVGRTTRGEVGGGLFLVNYKRDAVRNEKEMTKLRSRAREAVWTKVHEVISHYVQIRDPTL